MSTLAPFALRATVEDVYLPVGDVSCLRASRRGLGGDGVEARRQVDVTLISNVDGGRGARRNYTAGPSTWPLRFARPEQALQVAVSGSRSG